MSGMSLPLWAFLLTLAFVLGTCAAGKPVAQSSLLRSIVCVEFAAAWFSSLLLTKTHLLSCDSYLETCFEPDLEVFVPLHPSRAGRYTVCR